MTLPSAPKPGPKKPEPPWGDFKPDSWSGAFIVMAALLGVLWVVQIVNTVTGDDLTRFGLRPRELDGLEGVVTSPFLHANAGHLIANSIPFLGLGWVVLTSGLKNWLKATAIIVVVGGLFTWLVAPHGLVIGASGLVFGWLGYLIARAWFARKLAWIIIAIAAAGFFSSMFTGLLPGHRQVSWQAHVGGVLGGILAGYLLHPRKQKSPKVS